LSRSSSSASECTLGAIANNNPLNEFTKTIRAKKNIGNEAGVNVWKSYKKCRPKDRYINIALTGLAVIAFAFTWWTQHKDLASKEEQRRKDQEAYQTLVNTFNATQRLETLTRYVNMTMGRVKATADNITAKEVEISKTSRDNFLVNFEKQKQLLDAANELHYPLPYQMLLDCIFTIVVCN